MPTTPQSSLRYPGLGDDPNIPEDIQNLATDLDSRIIPRFTSATARNTAITAPVEGQLAYVNDINALTWYTGSAWQGAWTTYTVSWTTSGTAPTIGNGTLTGRYLQTPQLVMAEVRLVLGSTTTGGTGVWFFSLPVTASSAVIGGGSAYALDAGVQDYGCGVKMETTTAFRVVWHTGSIRSDAPVTPFAWASGDELRAQIIYSPA